MSENKRGAPLGNTNSAKNRVWSLAIQQALSKRSKGDQMKTLRELAEVLLSRCDEGDLSALKELGDRLEGKPLQSVEMNVTRNQSDLDDSELARIISEDRSGRTPSEKVSKKEPGIVH